MKPINVSWPIKNHTITDPHLKNFILNINMKNPKSLSSMLYLCLLMCAMLVTAMMITMLTMLEVLEQLQTQMKSHMLICQESSQTNHVNESNRFNQSINCKDCVSPIVPSTLEFSNLTEVRDDRNSDTVMLKPYNQMVLNQSIDHENNTLSQLYTGSLSKLLINLHLNSNNRQNLSTKTHSYTTTEDRTNSDRWSIKLSEESRARRLRRDVKDSEKRQSKEESEIWRQSKEDKRQQLSEEESEKLRKSRIKEETRQQNKETDKMRRQSKRKNKIWRQSEKKREKRRYSKGKGPLVATFIGGIPEQKLENTVYIGPWIKRNSTRDHQYAFTKFHLVENQMSIEIGKSGLYMISVQIFYFGFINNSYWILLNSEGSSMKEKLVTCATASSMDREATCYTSVVTYLKKDWLICARDTVKYKLCCLPVIEGTLNNTNISRLPSMQTDFKQSILAISNGNKFHTESVISNDVGKLSSDMTKSAMPGFAIPA